MTQHPAWHPESVATANPATEVTLRPARAGAGAHAEPVPRDGDELLALAQEAGGLGIFEWHVPSGLMRLSSQLQALFGMTHFDDRHETWLGHVWHEDVQAISQAIEATFAAKTREIVREFRIVRPAERSPRWMETRGIVFYDDGGAVEWVIGVIVDVTVRKRALIQLHAFAETLEQRVRARTVELESENEARRKAEESLRQAQKMEVVGQLTGGLAHDFNNLLTIVLGGLNIIERQLPSLPRSPAGLRIDRARRMAQDGADRAAKLIARLLAFARRQPLAPRAVDVNRLIADFADLLRRTLGEGISLAIRGHGDIWSIHVDSNQLENALLNLALNSRDAMPHGGSLTIETANLEFTVREAATLPEPIAPGQYVMIAVADSGTGMDPATIEHIFEPFFTTKDVGKGTGLGLSQVYGFVRQSAGHVRVESTIGIGTTVRIYLPRHDGAGGSGVKREDQDSRPEGGNERILVVEDDDSLRAYTTDALREMGYRVLEAGSGVDALPLLDQQPGIDLLLTDIVMPGGLNGRQLADVARTRFPGLQVLFMTGYGSNAFSGPGGVSSGLDNGLRVIGKPFLIEALCRQVRDILDEDKPN